MRCTAIFFDLYGTLVVPTDNAAAWNAWLDGLREALLRCGLGMDRESFSRRCDGFMSWPDPPAAPDGYTLYERRVAAFGTMLGLNMSAHQVRAGSRASVDAWQEHMTLAPEVPEVLTTLRQTHRLALVSNFDHPPHVLRVLRQHDLERYFQSIVISGDVGVRKPDPRIFERAYAETGAGAAEAIYVGDSNEDVGAARAAGMRMVRVRRPIDAVTADWTSNVENVRPAGADNEGVTLIADLRELLALVR
jgi:putative hydrolase of the HAD superfamily